MYSKFILVFLIVVLVGLVLFLGGYLISSKNLDQAANLSNLTRFDPSGQDAEKSVAAIHRLSTTRAASPALSEDGRQVLFFEAGSGKILNSDFTGKESAVVSGKLLSGFSSARWSRNGYETIITQSSKGSRSNFYLNLKTGKSSPLHSAISAPVWNMAGSKIAYLFFDTKIGEGQISVASPDGSTFKNIFPIRLDQINIAWPQENLLSFYSRTGDQQTLFTVNPEGNSLEKILGPVSHLQTLWSPDGSKVLVFYQENGQKYIKIITLKDKIEVALNLNTEAHKCVWSANAVHLFCGAKVSEEDIESLFAIEVQTQSAEKLFTPFANETIGIKNPFLTPAEDFIIFVNDYDQYLYSINL